MGNVYSTSRDAPQKKKIDDTIAKFTPVDMNSSVYLKELISLCSNGKPGVVDRASGLQFFIVMGGAEGFLDNSYTGTDASRRMALGGSTTAASSAPMTFVFDDNDLLVAFDKAGKLVSSALLQRPLSISNAAPIVWTESTANDVYAAWDGQAVTLYRNTNFGPKTRYHGIDYFGLRIDNSKHYYSSGSAQIDLHKKEATNGCVFIVDEHTPPYSDKAALNVFEPQFIRDVQAAIGSKTGDNIGAMHMLDVWAWPPKINHSVNPHPHGPSRVEPP